MSSFNFFLIGVAAAVAVYIGYRIAKKTQAVPDRGHVLRVLTWPFDEKKTVRQWYDVINHHLRIWKIDKEEHWLRLGNVPTSLWEAIQAIQTVEGYWLYDVGYVQLGYLARNYVYASIVQGPPIYHTCQSCGGTECISTNTLRKATLCPVCHAVAIQIAPPD